MTVKNIPINELMEKVLDLLKNQGYMDSTLSVYRRTYNRIGKFMDLQNAESYTKAIGEAFLRSTHVCGSTFSAYSCAVRRLNDCLEGIPYRCHHGNPSEKVGKLFEVFLNNYLDECEDSGNKTATINAKRKTCTTFLNYIEKAGCQDISSLSAVLASQALLVYSNKDNYARIRQFLKYLADKGITPCDLSVIVPRYRRRKALPTTYTPAEISSVESAVDTSTDVGKRDLAIIRLATRMGLRSGDIAGLKISEVDFDARYINIVQEKTGQPLSLQMPQEVSDALLSHLENTKGKAEDGYMFHSMSAPHRRITTSIIRHAVTNCFQSAGINISGKKHGPHAFRSTLASSMVNDGVSYETVRRILGHLDPDMIKHYARTDIERLRTCAIEPPAPTGLFGDYLSGKKVIARV